MGSFSYIRASHAAPSGYFPRGASRAVARRRDLEFLIGIARVTRAIRDYADAIIV